jgi:hypothetical protein
MSVSMMGNLAKFPSEEWVKLYMEQLNANKNYEEAAQTWEGDFLNGGRSTQRSN